MQFCILYWILEQKKDISETTGEIWIKLVDYINVEEK